jgi:hypothetical protein
MRNAVSASVLTTAVLNAARRLSRAAIQGAPALIGCACVRTGGAICWDRLVVCLGSTSVATRAASMAPFTPTRNCSSPCAASATAGDSSSPAPGFTCAADPPRQHGQRSSTPLTAGTSPPTRRERRRPSPSFPRSRTGQPTRDAWPAERHSCRDDSRRSPVGQRTGRVPCKRASLRRAGWRRVGARRASRARGRGPGGRPAPRRP